MMTPARFVNLLFHLLSVSAVFLGGCSRTTKGLAEVVKPPFKIQYPARSDIVPGAIWQTHGDVLASPMFDSPEAIKKTEAEGGFTKIEKQTIVVADAEADLAPLAQGTIKDLKAALEAKNITTLTVEGKYKIKGVQGLGYVVRPDTLAQCDDDYVLTLREIADNPKDRTKFVTQVVTVQDFKYVAKVSDAFKIEGDLKATGVVAGAGFNASNDKTLTWEMPPGQPMVVAWMTEVLPPLPENSVVGAQKAKQAEVKKKIESDFEKRLVALEGRDKNRSGLKFITGASFRLDDQLNAGMYLIKYQMVANGQEGCIDLLLVYPKDREHRPHLNMEKQQLGLDRIRSGYVDEAGKGDVRKVDYKLVKLQNGNHELHATVYRFDGGTSEGVASYIRICPP